MTGEIHPMKIKFVTDYVCPYCIVGKAALKAAILELGYDTEVEVFPMQLTMETEEKVDTWNDQARWERFKVLYQPAEELGIDAKFPPHVVPRPYTRLAFEGHYYAVDHKMEDAYDDAVYRAYFVEELDIGELNVLVGIAEKIGMDTQDFTRALEAGQYTEIVDNMDTYTKTVLDIHSVPTLMIDGEKIQFTDYSIEDAKTILKERYLAEKKSIQERFDFREIRTDEELEAAEIERICFPPHEACTEKMMVERVKKAQELFLVAIDKSSGKMAGFLNGLSTKERRFRDEFFTRADLFDPDGDCIMLLGLDVLPEYRLNGLATALMEEYISREQKRGRKLLKLTCLESRIPMYKKMGYIDEGLSDSTWGNEAWHEMSFEL